MKNSFILKVFLSALSGVLCFLSFPPFEIAFLSWLFLVPLLFALKDSTPRGSFVLSYMTGIVFFGALLYWLVNVSIPGMLLLVMVLSIIFGMFGLIAGSVLRRSMDLFILPFVWVVLELVRSCFFTGFPWGILGYSQYQTINLIQIADITGAYGVSFVVVAVNMAVFAVVTRSERRRTYVIMALFFLIMANMYTIYKFNRLYAWCDAEISVIQGNIPQKIKWDPSFSEKIFNEYEGLTREAAKEKPDLIVWPETAYPYLFGEGENRAREIGALSLREGIPILAGVVNMENGVYYNSAVLFNDNKEHVGLYRKLHLVPFGEYIPFEKHLSFLRGYIDKPIGDFGRGTEYTLFPLVSASSTGGPGTRVRNTNFLKFGVLICFEDVFPYISRNFVRQGADFLVNMTNDAWFGETAAPRQHLQASVFRAVENRVPLVRSANTGISCFIDTTGRVFSKVESEGRDIFVKGVDTGNIDVCRGHSVYTVYGDVFAYFCAVMAILLYTVEGFLRKKKLLPGKRAET